MSEIKTISGVMIDPARPRPELIVIHDVAHALSMLCRANGHFIHFYSVGQHCLNCAAEARARGLSTRLQLACLLHDASEAYLSDVTRPVKEELPAYLTIEKPLQDMIWKKYLGTPLTPQEEAQVFEIDDEMLYYEFEHLGEMALVDRLPRLERVPELDFTGFSDTKQNFLALFEQLSSGQNG